MSALVPYIPMSNLQEQLRKMRERPCPRCKRKLRPERIDSSDPDQRDKYWCSDCGQTWVEP